MYVLPKSNRKRNPDIFKTFTESNWKKIGEGTIPHPYY